MYLQNIKNFLYSEVLIQEEDLKQSHAKLEAQEESEEEVLRQRLEVRLIS